MTLQDLLNDEQTHKSVARIMYLQKALSEPVVYTREYTYLREADAICAHIMSIAKELGIE